MGEVNTKYGYIYKITNTINGKIYIGKRVGSTIDAKYWGSGTKIKKAIREFGLQNFSRSIVEWCSTKDILRERERYWIKTLNSRNPDIGYNIKRGGEGARDCEVNSTTVKEEGKIIGFQLPDNLRKQLEAEAEYFSLSVSAMVRLILAQRYRNVAKLTSEEEK